VLSGLQRMLRHQRHCWDMHFVHSALQALEVVRSTPIDAIVTDIMMPTMDGFELLHALQQRSEAGDIPVIVLTGCQEEGLKRRALDLGATDLLSKPVDPSDLVARLSNAVRLKTYHDELKARKDILEQCVEDRTAELEASRLEIIWRLAKAAEYRDEATGRHVVRVACYSRVIAERIGLERHFVDLLFLASPLHDIGKIGIPDGILLKRGKLSPDEWHVMKQHCAIGAEILQEDMTGMWAYVRRQAPFTEPKPALAGNPMLKTAASIALTHHERWDGTGYPAGLSSEEIPLESRIVSLCDTYDALRSARPYKPEYSERDSVDIIRKGMEIGRASCRERV